MYDLFLSVTSKMWRVPLCIELGVVLSRKYKGWRTGKFWNQKRKIFGFFFYFFFKQKSYRKQVT